MLTCSRLATRTLRPSRSVKINAQNKKFQRSILDIAKVSYFHTSFNKQTSDSKKVLQDVDKFADRHLGPTPKERQEMLDYMKLKVGVSQSNLNRISIDLLNIICNFDYIYIEQIVMNSTVCP